MKMGNLCLEECQERMDLSRPLGSRREIRYATHHGVQCLVGTGTVLDGIIVNMSDNGFCLKLAAPLMINQTIHIITSQALIACRAASVRWVSSQPDGSYLAGLSCH
jgi:hypothetical protein